MYEQEYGKAIEAARLAGDIIATYFGKSLAVHQKGNDQPVTKADQEANEIIQKTLLSSFPDDAWLSEETKDNADRLKKERVWIVDPLDGTKEFINTIPEFAISIALVIQEKPVVGVIYNPITDELYSARRGEGAFLNRHPIHVTPKKDLEKAHILASRSEISKGEWRPYVGRCMIHPLGGMAYKMARVAAGSADGSFSLSPKSEWDICAGALLIEEAKGEVSLPNGKPFQFNNENFVFPGIVYGNSSIHKQLLGLISSRKSLNPP